VGFAGTVKTPPVGEVNVLTEEQGTNTVASVVIGDAVKVVRLDVTGALKDMVAGQTVV
jgi:hypothetical protein